MCDRASKSILAESEICDPCTRIILDVIGGQSFDYDDLSGLPPCHINHGSSQARPQTTCNLCSFFRNTILLSDDETDGREAIALAMENIPGRKHGPTKLINLTDENEGMKTSVSYLYLVSGETFSHINDILPKVNFTQIRSWLNECSMKHTSQCSGSNDGLQLLDMYVIDCKTLDIVPAVFGQEYATLSYVWGQSSISANSCRGTDLALPDHLPPTINDAIAVCLQLDCPYLWVDKFCIPQSNPEETHRQIGNMDAIYRGCTFSIIAGAGENPSYGLPGISRERLPLPSFAIGWNWHLMALPSTEDLEDGAWMSRAWTYQETLLSCRQLIFTDRQMYFNCEGMLSMELASAFGSKNPATGTAVSEMLGFSEAIFEEKPLVIHTCISNYTRRQLSFPDDVLNAMSGIFKGMERRSDMRHLYGVPFYIPNPSFPNHKLCKDIQIGITHGLCWGSPKPSKRRRNFPSWSWAGWFSHYEISYEHQEFFNADNKESRAKSAKGAEIRVELRSGILLDWTDVEKASLDASLDVRLLSPFIHVFAYMSTIRFHYHHGSGGIFEVPDIAGPDHVYSVFPWMLTTTEKLRSTDEFLAMYMKYDHVNDRSHVACCVVVRNLGEYWERVALIKLGLGEWSTWRRKWREIKVG